MTPAWTGYIWSAWHALRDDRHYGAMGGFGRIYYSALSAYAADHGMSGADLGTFLTLMRAIDEEYVAWVLEEQREERERS